MANKHFSPKCSFCIIHSTCHSVDTLCFMIGMLPERPGELLTLPFIILYVGGTDLVLKNQFWVQYGTIMLLLEPQRQQPSAVGRHICLT